MLASSRLFNFSSTRWAASGSSRTLTSAVLTPALFIMRLAGPE